jgi:hypothetical protein
MLINPRSSDEVRDLVAREIGALANRELAARILPLLRPPVRQTLHWEYGNNEPFTAWRFADLGEHDVWAAYCAFGHGSLGYPWGLVSSKDVYFGTDCGWYREMRDLFEEWFL